MSPLVTFSIPLSYGILLLVLIGKGNQKRSSPYLSILSLNAGKYGPEKHRIRTPFM